jgi:hypothetical protein
VYAGTLGITLGGDSGGSAPSGDDGQCATPPIEPAAEPAQEDPAPLPVEAAPGIVIDFNEQYEATVEGNRPINWGNVILGVMIVGFVAGGGAFVFVRERKLRRPYPLTPKPQPVAATAPAKIESAQPQSPISNLQSPLSSLLPQLEKLDPRGLRALQKILADPIAASDLLHALARIDPQLIEEVRRLDRRELSLLMALAGEG